jgi:hypothetical protein
MTPLQPPPRPMSSGIFESPRVAAMESTAFPDSRSYDTMLLESAMCAMR